MENINIKDQHEKKKERQHRFIDLLKKYINIKTVEIIITLKDGKTIALYKNKERKIINDDIILYGDGVLSNRIYISKIEKAELFAA